MSPKSTAQTLEAAIEVEQAARRFGQCRMSMSNTRH